MNPLSNRRHEAKEKRNHHSPIEILCMMNESHEHLAESAVHHNEALEKSPDAARRAETHVNMSGGICDKSYTHSCYKTYTSSLSAERNTRLPHFRLLNFRRKRGGPQFFAMSQRQRGTVIQRIQHTTNQVLQKK